MTETTRRKIIDALAAKFTELLHEEIGTDALDEVARLNAEDNDPLTCRSHDHCDANQVMINAYAALEGIHPDAVDVCDNQVAVLMDAAWDVARKIWESKPPEHAKVCMFIPAGTRWFATHEAAVEAIRQDYRAVSVKRWRENGLNYEDHMDEEGRVVAQLEFPE